MKIRAKKGKFVKFIDVKQSQLFRVDGDVDIYLKSRIRTMGCFSYHATSLMTGECVFFCDDKECYLVDGEFVEE